MQAAAAGTHFGGLPRPERCHIREKHLLRGHFSRSWIPLRQRDPLKRDFMAKDTVYSLPLRGWYFLSEKESTQRNLCETANSEGDQVISFYVHCDFDSTA